MAGATKLPYELRLAYGAVLCFITAQYVVNERPWEQIFRIIGLLLFMGSTVMASRRYNRKA
jgi:hypothetical protein